MSSPGRSSWRCRWLLLAAATAAPKATTINVTITDKAITLSKKTAPVGAVTFSVKNNGKAQHNFRIAGKSTPVLKPNATARLAVTFAKAGGFAYASTVKGDAAKGLKGDVHAHGSAARSRTTTRSRCSRPRR